MRLKFFFLSLTAALAPTLSYADHPNVTVTSIVSTKECSFYTNFWGNWILAICNNQFPDLKERLRSSLIEAFEATENTYNGLSSLNLSLSGRVSELNSEANRTSTSSFCVGNVKAVATLDWTVTGSRGGQSIAGSTNKKVEIASHIETGSNKDCRISSGGEIPFNELQTEIARSTARKVAFRYNPLRVSMVDQSGRVQFNYGSPVLGLGMIVQVGGQNGYPTRYQITSTGDKFSWATPYGDRANIRIGEEATVIEADSPENNARRFAPVELP